MSANKEQITTRKNAKTGMNQHSKNTFLHMIRLLNETNQYYRRHDYAWRHSNNRTESTKELTDAEMWAVINELKETFKEQLDNLQIISAQCDKMRKKIISKAHQMFWELPGGKIDIKRINDWCIQKGPYKKKLNDHDIKELGILTGVFEKIYKQYMNKI